MERPEGLPAGPGGRWRTSQHTLEGTACPSKHNPEVRVILLHCRVLRDRGGLGVLQSGEPGSEDPSWLWPSLSPLSCMSAARVVVGCSAWPVCSGWEPGAVSESTRIVS